MKALKRSPQLQIFFAMFLLTWLGTPVLATKVLPQSKDSNPVKLTVLSSCASVNVRLSTGETLQTPFQQTFERGDTISLDVLDSSVNSCNASEVVSRFRRLIVNNEFFPKKQKSAQVRLDRDTSVLILYGSSDQTPVTLSVWSTCEYGGGVRVGLTAPSVAGQEATFMTHFDAQLLPGQNVRLEAMTAEKPCGDTGTLLDFLGWSAGGKVYPDGQTALEIPLDQYTTAVALYGLTYIKPALRISSFQLLREGQPAAFIKRKDELSHYTVVLNGENFPAGATVWTDFDNFTPAEIVSINPTRIEARFPSGKSKNVGVVTVAVKTADESLYSNAIPLVINR